MYKYPMFYFKQMYIINLQSALSPSISIEILNISSCLYNVSLVYIQKYHRKQSSFFLLNLWTLVKLLYCNDCMISFQIGYERLA